MASPATTQGPADVKSQIEDYIADGALKLVAATTTRILLFLGIAKNGGASSARPSTRRGVAISGGKQRDVFSGLCVRVGFPLGLSDGETGES